MRTPQLRPPSTSVFTSKRFVVALCAAIAMVLGAMSVGTNTPPVYNEPVTTTPPPVANRAGIFVQDNRGEQRSTAEPTTPLAPSYRTYQTPLLLGPSTPAVNPPATNTPAKNLEIKLNLKSLNTLGAAPPATLLLGTDEQQPETTISTLAEPTDTETLLQSESTLAEDTPTPDTEPNLQNVTETTGQ